MRLDGEALRVKVAEIVKTKIIPKFGINDGIMNKNLDCIPNPNPNFSNGKWFGTLGIEHRQQK